MHNYFYQFYYGDTVIFFVIEMNSTVMKTINQADIFSKKRGVTFGINSSKEISFEKATIPSKNLINQQCLPINFFHSPGEYNKMLIKLSSQMKTNPIEKQMGIVRNLQFINDPLFEKEKEKRYQRIRTYESKVKQDNSVKAKSVIEKCQCCCCDNYCRQCASNTNCEKDDLKSEKTTEKEMKMLIDIEGMLRGEKKKKKEVKKIPLFDQQFSKCHVRSPKSKYRIQELINSTLIKQIQGKRKKNLEKLFEQKNRLAVQEYNQMVRSVNKRAISAEAKRNQAPIKPTKAEIRQAYWQSIKDLLIYQLEKQKSRDKKIACETKHEKCHYSPDKRSLSPQMITKMRKVRGKRALQEQRNAIKQKNYMQMLKAQKLKMLDQQQLQIVKKCRAKKFIPNKSMIEQAFKDLA